jgi:hypothetical protein
MLIACLRPGTLAHNIFSLQQVVFIGLISYSLYLWHWGVLAVSRWTIGIHWWSAPIQVALMLAMSFVSYRHIEAPIRHSKLSIIQGHPICCGIIASSSCCAILLLLTIQSFHEKLYAGTTNGMEVNYTLAKAGKINPSHECNIYHDGIKATSISRLCGLQVGLGRPTIFLLGDSHIEQFDSEIESFALEKNYNTRLVWGGSCLFPAAIIRGEAGNQYSGVKCFDLQSSVEQSLFYQIKSGDIVIIGNALYAHFSQTGLFGTVN